MGSDGARKLASQITERSDRSRRESALQIGEVKEVTNGVAIVRYLGANLPMPRLASYTPSVGHQVVLARGGGRFIILGQLTGIPT